MEKAMQLLFTTYVTHVILIGFLSIYIEDLSKKYRGQAKDRTYFVGMGAAMVVMSALVGVVLVGVVL